MPCNMKHLQHFLETPLKHSESTLETSNIYPWNILDTLLKPLWKLLKRPLKHPWNFTEKNFKTSLGKPPKKISQKDHLKKTFLDYHRLVLSLAILNYLWLSLSSIRVQVEAQESKLSLDISVCLWLFQAILGYPSYLYQVSGSK